MLDSLLKQIRDRISNQSKQFNISQRLENILITLAYLSVEIPDRCKVINA